MNFQSSSSTNGKIGLVVDEADTKCCVCWSIPCWQVYTCPSGHVTCHLCKGRGIDKCSVCKSGIARNMYAEKTLSEMVIGCPYDGCETKLKQPLMKDHIEECLFQPIKCFAEGTGGLGNRCGRVLPLKDFGNHLKQDHKFPVLCANATSNFSTQSSKSSWFEGPTKISNFIFPPILHLDGMDFLLQAFQDTNEFQSELFFWVAALCTKSRAKGYKFRLTFRGVEGSIMQEVTKSSALPVLSVLDRTFLTDGVAPYQKAMHLAITEVIGMGSFEAVATVSQAVPTGPVSVPNNAGGGSASTSAQIRNPLPQYQPQGNNETNRSDAARNRLLQAAAARRDEAIAAILAGAGAMDSIDNTGFFNLHMELLLYQATGGGGNKIINIKSTGDDTDGDQRDRNNGGNNGEESGSDNNTAGGHMDEGEGQVESRGVANGFGCNVPNGNSGVSGTQGDAGSGSWTLGNLLEFLDRGERIIDGFELAKNRFESVSQKLETICDRLSSILKRLTLSTDGRTDDAEDDDDIIDEGSNNSRAEDDLMANNSNDFVHDNDEIMPSVEDESSSIDNQNDGAFITEERPSCSEGSGNESGQPSKKRKREN